MFERFTDKARRAVVLAQEESRDLEHDYIGTEHVLLGLMAVPDSVAARVLTEHGLDGDELRKQVVALVGRGNAKPKHHIPFTPRAKKVMEFSLREALYLGHNYIGTEHLLLGIIREGNGVGAQLLGRADLDMGMLRTAVVDAVTMEATGTEGARSSATEPTPVRADGVEDFLAPTCPGCRAAVEETAAFKTIDVPQEGGPGHITVRFVFCEACGRTLTSTIIDE